MIYFIIIILGILLLAIRATRIQKRENEDAYQHMHCTVHRLLGEHQDALLTQHRKLITIDPYGNELRDSWDQEREYFHSNVIDPALQNEILTKELSKAKAHLFENLELGVQWELTKEHGHSQAIEQCFKIFVKTAIEAVVEQMLAEKRCSTPSDVSDLSPTEFESLCKDLLTEAGWDAQVVAGSGDQGVDVVARCDGVTAVFQCKLYSSPLGNKPVQEIHTGRTFYDAQIAAVVSNADYTSGARAAATQTGVRLLHYSELATFEPDQE